MFLLFLRILPSASIVIIFPDNMMRLMIIIILHFRKISDYLADVLVILNEVKNLSIT